MCSAGNCPRQNKGNLKKLTQAIKACSIDTWRHEDCQPPHCLSPNVSEALSGLHTTNKWWPIRVGKLKLVCVNLIATCWQTVAANLTCLCSCQPFSNLLLCCIYSLFPTLLLCMAEEPLTGNYVLKYVCSHIPVAGQHELADICLLCEGGFRVRINFFSHL